MTKETKKVEKEEEISKSSPITNKETDQKQAS
jgi:hypothetical protein